MPKKYIFIIVSDPICREMIWSDEYSKYDFGRKRAELALEGNKAQYPLAYIIDYNKQTYKISSD